MSLLVLYALPLAHVWVVGWSLMAGICGSAALLVSGFWLRRNQSKQSTFEKTAPNQQHQIQYDWLTNLPNRTLLLQHITSKLQQPTPPDSFFALMFLEVDRFSIVNDSLGHAIGDDILRTMSARLVQALGANDMAARMGGDEFVVVLDAVESLDHAVTIAHHFQHILRQPYLIQDREIFTSVSIGIALGQPHSTAEMLLREADTAMYQAKTRGINSCVVFEQLDHEALRLSWQLELELRGALDRGELHLVYQPIVDLPTGAIMGMEALVRWQHPERGVVLPNEFISIAEASGMIVPIGAWVLETACAQFQAWRNAGDMPYLKMMSVNLSARQLMNPDIVGSIKSIIERTGIHPRYLELEITESMVMTHIEQTIATLEQLKDLGLQLAIDDFGTGYSSLSYLHRFPLDRLKVDRSFVRAMRHNSRNTEIVRTIIQLSQQLAMDVIAEGIETLEEAALLRELGCDYGQGYHFAQPLQAVDFLSWSKQRDDRQIFNHRAVSAV